jgi:hypothetical protein
MIVCRAVAIGYRGGGEYVPPPRLKFINGPVIYNHMKNYIFEKIMKNGAFFVFTACSES